MKLSYRNKKLRFQKRKSTCNLCWHNISIAWPLDEWGCAWYEASVPQCKLHKKDGDLGQSIKFWGAIKLSINILRGKY